MTSFRAAAMAALFVLASCVAPREVPTGPRPSGSPRPEVAVPPVAPAPTVPRPPANAREVGVTLVPGTFTAGGEPGSRPVVAGIAVSDEIAQRALAAFRLSCPSLVKRTDATNLTRLADWRAACDEVRATPAFAPGAAPAFLDRHFELARVGDGKAFATGYFEPEIAGSRVQALGYDVPIYRVPPDLVQGTFADGKAGRGRYDEAGAFVLYHDRAAIDAGALAGKALEIAYAADAIDLFFLQIQGSGRLRLPDGGVMRIGYAGQNGREYVAIGRIMKERGLLGPGQTSMQGIVAWLRANPEEGRAIMAENKSYVFFKELTGPGPLGSLGVPVSARASVAVDPRFVPYGAPVLLMLDRAEANGLWVAQDTGGAIKGANRFDTFWGAGEDAKRIAGGMQGRGEALILLPRGTVARLRADASSDAPPQP